MKKLGVLFLALAMILGTLPFNTVDVRAAAGDTHEVYNDTNSAKPSYRMRLLDTPNDVGEVVYCFNHELHQPVMNTVYKPFEATVFGDTSSSLATTPRLQGAALKDAILKVLAAGHPRNGAGLQGTLTDAQFRHVTQCAIWYYVDTYDAAGNAEFSTGDPDADTPMLAAYNKLIATDLAVTVPEGLQVNLYKYKGGLEGDAGDRKMVQNFLGSGFPNTVKTTFNLDGGSMTDPTEVILSEGSKVVEPSTPTKAGHVFKGWFVDDVFSAEYNWDSEISQDHTIYAKWEPEAVPKVTVTFNTYGGTAVTPVEVDKGNPIDKPSPDPTKTGFRFAGWYTDAGLQTPYVFGDKVETNIELHAKWVELVKVTFNSQGGDTTPVEQTIDKGTTPTVPPVPTQAGKVFKGWFTEATGGTKYEFNTPIDANTTLYAQWENATVTVTFDAKGGEPVPAVQTIDKGAKATVPTAPTKDGFTFKGWFATETGGTAYDFNTAVDADTTLYAQWEAVTPKVTLSFNTHGGSAVDPITVDKGTVVDKPNDPDKADHTFAGWYTDDSFTTPYDFTAPLNADAEAHAMWAAIPKFVVSFDTDGGGAILPQEVVKDGFATRPPVDPEKNGFEFLGWFTEKDGPTAFDFANTPITKDTIVYAKWASNAPVVTVKVTFDTDGGSAIADQDVVVGTNATKPASDPIKAGFTFKGWFTEKDGTVAFDFDTPINGETTIYAKWEAVTPVVTQVKVTFDAKGGEPVPAVQTIDKGAKATEPTAPTKDGFTFKGWFATETGGTAYDFNTAVDADTTLYAQWEAVPAVTQVKVTFDAKGGEPVPAVQTIDKGAKATEPTAPTKDGFTFKGWFATETGGTAYDFNTAVDADTTLYAQWEAVKVTLTYDTDGGSAIAPTTVDYGTVVPEPAKPTKAKNRFDDWYTDKNFNTKYDFTKELKADETVYAKWVEQVTVTVVTNSPTTIGAQVLDKGEVAVVPPTPEKPGFTFKGWFTAETGGQEYDFKTPVNSDITIYAQWEAVTPVVKYTVTFDTDGGSAIDNQTVVKGEKATRPTDPKRANFDFNGWVTTQGGTITFDFDSAINGDTTIYATWTARSPIVTVVVGDGSTPVEINVDGNGKIEVPKDPERPGYKFGGWFEDEELTVPMDFTKVITGDMKIYAKWTAEGTPGTVKPVDKDAKDKNPKTGDEGAMGIAMILMLMGAATCMGLRRKDNN